MPCILTDTRGHRRTSISWVKISMMKNVFIRLKTILHPNKLVFCVTLHKLLKLPTPTHTHTHPCKMYRPKYFLVSDHYTRRAHVTPAIKVSHTILEILEKYFRNYDIYFRKKCPSVWLSHTLKQLSTHGFSCLF